MTLDVTDAALLESSVAFMLYSPVLRSGSFVYAVNVPVPSVTELAFSCVLPSVRATFEPGLKPLPATVTWLPAEGECGVTVTDAAVVPLGIGRWLLVAPPPSVEGISGLYGSDPG